MSSDGLTSPGNEVRQLACDRCRGQKLRCVRGAAGYSASCVRCLRAGATCITSKPRRMGRPTRSDPSRREKSTVSVTDDGILGVTSETWTTLSPNTSSNDGASVGNSVPHSVRCDFQGWQAQTLELAQCNSPDHQGVPTLTWPWEGPDRSDFYTDSPDAGNAEVNAFVIGLRTSTSPGPGQSTLHTDAAVPRSSEHIRVRSSDNAPDLQETLGNDVIEGQRQTPTQSDKSGREDCVQQLSELNMRLHRLLQQFQSAPRPMCLSALAYGTGAGAGRIDTESNHYDSNHIGDIFNGSERFLKILSVFFSCPHHTHTATSSSSGSNESWSDYFDHGLDHVHVGNDRLCLGSSTINAFIGCESPLPGSSSLSSSATPGLSPAATNKPAMSLCPTKPDVSIILLILNCYIYIIRIYNLIFSQIHRSLLPILSGHRPSLPVLPGLQINGFPLQSGNLQVTILVQVAVHMVSRVEKALGLPREYCIDRDDNRSRGILSDLELTELFRMVIRQEDCGNHQDGGGGSRSLKEHFKSIRQLLRNSIAL